MIAIMGLVAALFGIAVVLAFGWPSMPEDEE